MRVLMRSFLVLSMVSSSAVFGQAFEQTPSLLLTGGLTVPTGSGAEGWDLGPEGRIVIRFPITGTMTIGISGGLLAPASDVDELTLLQIPLSLMAYFPLAPEAASTAFLAVGGGITVNTVSSNSPWFDDDTETRPTYSIRLGYSFRPEQMQSTMFEIGIQYEQQLEEDVSDWRSIGIQAGLGLCF